MQSSNGGDNKRTVIAVALNSNQDTKVNKVVAI